MANGSISSQAQPLGQSDFQLQAIFDNLKEGIVVLDRAGNMVFINKAASRLHGTEPIPVSVREISEIFEVFVPGGILLPKEEWPSARALRGDFVQGFELLIRRRDTGLASSVQIDTSAIRDPHGAITHIVIGYWDLTKSRHIDLARARLASIVEFSEDAIIGKDRSGVVTSWNRGATKVFGFSAEEMMGQSIRRLIPPDLEQQEDEILRQILDGGTVDDIETLRRRKDGAIINVSLTISPIRDEDGTIVGASKIARDTTQMRQLERQLRQSQKMEAIGQLTGGIAHDFNNLLGVIFGNLDLLERLILDNPAALKRLRTSRKAADRGADLTRRMLTFSSKEELSPRCALVDDSILNIVEMASRALGPEIELVTHLDPTVPAIFVDGPGLESALLNLVVNARDAMPKGGSVTIATELTHLEESYPPVRTGELKAGSYACISISDTGEGMTSEVAERAFEPFFTTKPRHKGTGLGLAMVYGFVKQSGGTVRIYSEPGYGTTVSLFFPLADEIADPVRAVRDDPPPKLGTGHVLVVDDDEDLLDIAVAYLEEMGFSTSAAADGPSALRLLREHHFDLLITDIIMPGGMNGVELVERAHEVDPALKTISCSGFPANALAERSLSTIKGPWLHKPFHRSEFQAMVHRVMSSAAPGTIDLPNTRQNR